MVSASAPHSAAAKAATAPFISAKTCFGVVTSSAAPSLRARRAMTSHAGSACPGGANAARSRCSLPWRLVIVPWIYGQSAQASATCAPGA
jgi:hypothetical protein